MLGDHFWALTRPIEIQVSQGNNKLRNKNANVTLALHRAAIERDREITNFNSRHVELAARRKPLTLHSFAMVISVNELCQISSPDYDM